MFSFFSRKTDPKTELKKVLKDYKLPSFPAVVMEILQRIRSPYSSAQTIAEAIALDPGITVKVLSIANSAAFSPRNKVNNLTQAIALVGISQLESLVLGVGVAKGIPNQACQWHDPAEFWLAAARRAMLATELARVICPSRESECFTAAFLQDMALPFLACHRSDIYGPILEKWHLDGGDLAEIERESLAWDHAEVATWICSEWGLPESIAAAIRSHHGEELDDHEILEPVRLVSILREGEKHSGLEEIRALAIETHGISPQEMKEMISQSFEKATELARLMV